MIDEKQKAQAYNQKILDRIIVTRSLIHKGQIAPKGYIYYPVKFNTFKNEKYEGVRMIEKEKEAAIGMDAIIANIKQIIIAKHFPEYCNSPIEEALKTIEE